MDMKPPSIQNSSARASVGANSSLIQIVLLGIVFVLFSWFILKPKLSSSAVVRADLKAAQQQQAKIKQDKQDLSRLVSELRSSTNEISKIDEALPLSGRVSKVYVLLVSLVQSSGMTLTLINADDSSKAVSAADKALLENPFKVDRDLHTITLSTTVSGTMEQFKNLLQLIETNGRVLDIETLEVIGGEPITKFDIKVKAYSYDQNGIEGGANE